VLKFNEQKNVKRGCSKCDAHMSIAIDATNRIEVQQLQRLLLLAEGETWLALLESLSKSLRSLLGAV
jgi:hypothetical protein